MIKGFHRQNVFTGRFYIHSFGMTVLILTLFLYYIFLYLCNLSKINADLAPLGSQRAFLNSRKGVPPRLRVQRYGNFPN